jgi:Uncharacterised nucleotidyltransferase
MWDDIGGQNGKRGLCDTIYGLPNPWPICPRLPAAVSAVLAALHLRDPVTEGLRSLDDRQWRDALAFCDSSRLTLYPRDTLREFMPQWVRERTDENAARNVQRLPKLEQIHSTVSQRLASADIEFVVLKGITHGSLFGGRPENRMQSDIDLYSSHESVEASRHLLLALGYEPVEGMDRSPTDHLPAMVGKTAWERRGDYFDLGIPTPIELHFQFWNERTERLQAPGTNEFWNRRTRRSIAGLELAVPCPADALAYPALHVLRHLLRGSAHPSHVYEIASILDAHTGNDAFWSRWTSRHAPKLRRLEAVAFRLAWEWFGCRLSPVPAAEIEQLPATTQAWFAAFATSPVRSVFDSNKDELWLHWTLLDSRRDSWSIARRRLLPGSQPLRPRNNYFPETKRTWSQWLSPSAEYVSYLLSRIVHHLLALPRTAASGARSWWCLHGTLPPERAQPSEEE